MGRRGPKAKPTLLELSAQVSDPSGAPVEVAADPAALELWTQLVADLQSLLIWHRTDAGLLARYCVMRSMWRQSLEAVRRDGPAAKTRTGYRCVTPEMVLVTKLSASLLTMEVELGLAPRARSKMRITTPPPPSPLDEFLM